MNNWKRIVVFLVCLAIFVSGIVLLVNAHRYSSEVVYRGYTVFNSTQEYQDFKIYLMQPEVKIKEIQILCSEPPIWVRYSIEVPRFWFFPFNFDCTKGVVPSGVLLGLTLMIALGGGGATGSGIWAFAEDE